MSTSIPVAPGLGAKTLCEAFQTTAATVDPQQVALRTHDDTLQLTMGEYATAVQQTAAGLAALGVARGDTVGVMLTNRPEFNLVDTAALHLGATPFSIYNTSSPEQITYLLNHAANRVMITEQAFVQRIAAAQTDQPITIVVVDGPDGGEHRSLADLRGEGPADFDFEATWKAVQPDDVACLIYTSGTTGPPKGVELTHANLMFNLQKCDERYPMTARGSCVSYLPSAHMADRIFSHYLGMVTGWPITSVADPKTVFEALPGAKPTWFLGVPRIWEKLRAALLARFSGLPEPQRAGVEGALERAIAAVRDRQQGVKPSDELQAALDATDTAVFKPVREQLGLDDVALLMTGAAPIPAAVQEFFLAIGLPLGEGFGMSETGALGMGVETHDIRIGTVGKPMPGTEAMLAEDGELLMRGPHIMRGYRNDPERTTETIDADGWLHTGDIATIDDDGFVRIVDRKKELIINAAGKNMSPANIENTLKSASPLIGQAIVIGDRRPYNVALLVLDPDVATAFAAENGLADTSVSAVAADQRVQAAITAAVEKANDSLSRVEQIKHHHLLAQEWLPDGDELTPTMKLKRRAINEKYADVVDAMYDS